jgi:hypothetical protein
MISIPLKGPNDQLRSWAYIFLHPVTLNLAVLFLLSLVVFGRNNEFLFYGSDGKFEVTLIDQFPQFAPPLIGCASQSS